MEKKNTETFWKVVAFGLAATIVILLVIGG